MTIITCIAGLCGIALLCYYAVILLRGDKQ